MTSGADVQLWYKAVKRTEDPNVFRSFTGDTLWRVGHTNTLEGDDEPVLCMHGFHACQNPVAPFLRFLGYGYSHLTDVLLEVTLGGKLVSDGMKTAATSCTPLRVVPDEELLKLMQTPTIVVNAKTGHEYHATDGKLHRDGDEPAVTWSDGSRGWFQNGIPHRDGDKPAVIWANGSLEWCKDGNFHREGDKPARIWADDSQEWYKDGKRHRDGEKPAVVMANGTLYWYKDGKLHRGGDKPASVMADGSQAWYIDGVLHRDGDEPARIWADGSRAWYTDGERHRDGDKPAVIWADGTQEWYLYGVLLRCAGAPAGM